MTASFAVNVEKSSQAVLVRHATSFRWAQLFLNKVQRKDCAIAYAFCRLVDDAVDEADTEADARAGLERVRRDLESDVPNDPLILAYRQLAQRCGFGLEPARQLILGAESDLGPVALEDDEQLGAYCYRVAGTVGLMMCGILGVSDARATRHAVDLGIAMQLTNICRDVREDAARGRLYLPVQRLDAHGLGAADILGAADVLLTPGSVQSPPGSGLREVVRDLLELADRAYVSGELGLRYLPLRPRLAIAIASRIYGGIGRRLRRVHDCNAWVGRTKVPAMEKVWLMFQALGLWLRVGLFGRSTRSSADPSPPLPGFSPAGLPPSLHH